MHAYQNREWVRTTRQCSPRLTCSPWIETTIYYSLAGLKKYLCDIQNVGPRRFLLRLKSMPPLPESLYGMFHQIFTRSTRSIHLHSFSGQPALFQFWSRKWFPDHNMESFHGITLNFDLNDGLSIITLRYFIKSSPSLSGGCTIHRQLGIRSLPWTSWLANYVIFLSKKHRNFTKKSKRTKSLHFRLEEHCSFSTSMLACMDVTRVFLAPS